MQDLQVFYKVSEVNHFAENCIFDLGDVFWRFPESEAKTHIVGSCSGMSSSVFPFVALGGHIIGSILVLFT